MHEEQVEGQKQLIARAERAIAENRVRAANAAANAAEAKDRVERLKRGEDVGGSSKPVDVERILREAGLTKADIDYVTLLGSSPENVMETVFEISAKASVESGK